MPTGLTATTVVNAALEQIAAQTRITSLTDGSSAANQASVVYAPTVQVLLRELDPDFAMLTTALAVLAGVPPAPWAFQYGYPADCIRLRQVRPSVGAFDPFDPQPVRAQVAFDGAGNKIITTNLAAALGVYTSSAPTEALWDAAFTDAVIRRLANPLAMAISGRPDFAEKILQQSVAMAQTAEAVDDSGFRRGFGGG